MKPVGQFQQGDTLVSELITIISTSIKLSPQIYKKKTYQTYLIWF